MPLRRDWLDDWVRNGGTDGWFYHRVFAEQLLPWILRDGLLPRSQTRVSGLQPGMPSRPTHIYLVTHTDRRAFEEAGMGSGPPHLAVHAGSLDPDAIDSDEDKIGADLTKPPAAVLTLPGASSLRWRQRGELVWKWAAANTGVIDQPEWVKHSLQQGAVAYRKPIPLGALRFHSEVREHWLVAPRGVPAELRKFDGHAYYKGP